MEELEKGINQMNKVKIYSIWLKRIYIEIVDLLYLFEKILGKGFEEEKWRIYLINQYRLHPDKRDINDKIMELVDNDEERLEYLKNEVMGECVELFLKEVGRRVDVNEDNLYRYYELYQKYERKKIRTEWFDEEYVVRIGNTIRVREGGVVGTTGYIPGNLGRTQRIVAGFKKNWGFEDFKNFTGVEDRSHNLFNIMEILVEDKKLHEEEKKLMYAYIAYIMYNRDITDLLKQISVTYPQKAKIKNMWLNAVGLNEIQNDRKEKITRGDQFVVTTEWIDTLELDDAHKVCMKRYINELNGLIEGIEGKTNIVKVMCDYLGEKVGQGKRCGTKKVFKDAFNESIESKVRVRKM